MARTMHIFAAAALLASAAELLAGSEDKSVVIEGPRKEFHLTMEYPFVFRPTDYLVVQGPAPVRYGAPAIDCSHRMAPPLPAAVAKPTPTPTPKPAPQEEKTAAAASKAANAEDVIVSSAGSPPAYPVSDNAPSAPQKGSADFSKPPDEVVGYFRNPYNFVPNTHRFFDPIFEPAQAQQGPPSSATYIQKP